MIRELVCIETQEYDFRSPAAGGRQTPTEARMFLHKLMRLVACEGASWLTEILEIQRESVTALLSFALDAYERCVGHA